MAVYVLGRVSRLTYHVSFISGIIPSVLHSLVSGKEVILVFGCLSALVSVTASGTTDMLAIY